MKKAITASAILFAALIAYATMTGDLNTWLGYMAGEDATGERTTVQGAGAGGGASYLYRTELIGAASGVYGYWFQDSVGIGYRALRHSSYMTNVIAIGSHALEGVQGMGTMADVTWIGGHFVANPPNPDPTMGWSQVPGEFYITGDASKTNGLAPIWYDGTTLYLNAPQIVTPFGAISGGGYVPGESSADTYAYDYYVSDSTGSDDYGGTSPSAPFKTLDKAISMASNKTVCVMAGTYAYPSLFGSRVGAPYNVDFIAPAGASSTFISITNSANPGVIHPSTAGGSMTYFKGFTFSNTGQRFGREGTKPTGSIFRGTFEYAWFENCRFTGINDTMSAAWCYEIWTGCVLVGCKVEATLRFDGSTHDDKGSMGVNDAIFLLTHLENCVVDIETEGGASYPSFGKYNHMTNSIVRTGPLYRAGAFHSGIYTTPKGTPPGIFDSTMAVTRTLASDRTEINGRGSIVGIGTNAAPDSLTVNLTDGIYTNATTVLGALGPDNRIRTSASWFFKGYNSAGDRETLRLYKEAILEETSIGTP